MTQTKADSPSRAPHLEGLPELEGKRVLITGGNAGIGQQIAKNLAALGADVTIACRNHQRGQAALSELHAAGHATADLLILDQSSQASIAKAAEEFTARHERLDVLVNNAGIYPDTRRQSVDGVELTFATNVMGYFLFTRALEDVLAKSAPSRVIFIASKLAGGLELEDLEFEHRRFGGIKAYKQSKQANRMLARRFADRLASRGVKVATVHPGGIKTSIGRHQRGLWGVLVRLAFRTQKPVTAGADTATWLATLADDELESGKFWADRAERECEFVDKDREEALWAYCESLAAG